MVKQFIIGCTLLLVACNGGSQRRIEATLPTFRTTADSKLYFQNVRQIYYDQETPENTQLAVYRFGKRNRAADRPIINLSIVNNWLHDEAYVLIEPNAYLKNRKEITVQWKDAAKNQSGTHRFAFGSKEKHYQFATELYQSINSGHALTIQDNRNQWVPLFAADADRDNFRKTMVDYFRLVNVM